MRPTPRSTLIKRLLWFIALCFFPLTIHSEIYIYTDAEGNTQYTNVPRQESQKKKKKKKQKEKNTSNSKTGSIYIYTDDEGIIRYTNIPGKGPRQSIVQAESAYNWTDDLGKLRKIHRVDISKYDSIIIEAAKYYTLPSSLVKAVIATESSFNPNALSPAKAMGLMQLIEGTASDMSVRNPWDPRDNIYGGTRYLRILANQFDGDLRKTLAAYNAGPTAVKRAGGVPPYKETKHYVKRVLHLYHYYQRSGNPGQ